MFETDNLLHRRVDLCAPGSIGHLIPDVPAEFPPSAIHREKSSLNVYNLTQRKQTQVEKTLRSTLAKLRVPHGVPVYWLLGQQIFFNKVLRLFCHRRLAVFKVLLSSSQSSPLFHLPPKFSFEFPSLVFPALGFPFLVLLLAAGQANCQLH